MDKRCCVCQKVKPRAAFNKHKKRADGLQVKCKDCSSLLSKAHYKENEQSYKERNQRRRVLLYTEVNKIKANPCMDCGYTFPACAMDFDHRDGKDKTAGISLLITNGASISRILAEIQKCDLVCACCHRIRTFLRYGSRSEIV